jgi:hypothetical protein
MWILCVVVYSVSTVPDTLQTHVHALQFHLYMYTPSKYCNILVTGTSYLRWITACTYPVSQREIDSLSEIESLVETSMVSSRKGHHKLTSTLVSTNNLEKR